MERTDRIWLITASVLVVLLLAGAGVLWWKRTETIARYSTTSQGELALAPMETSDTVLPPEAPKPKPKAAPRQPKGSEPGYLTRVRKTGSAIYVTYDPAAFLTGSEASLYAAKQQTKVPPSGYLIANQTHTTKRFELAKSAEIVVLKGAATEKMTPDAFLKAMGSATPDPVLKKALWWVFEDGEIIVRMEQTPL